MNVPPGGTMVVMFLPSRSERRIDPSFALGLPMLVQYMCPAALSTTNAVRNFRPSLDDRLEIGAVGICGQHAAASEDRGRRGGRVSVAAVASGVFSDLVSCGAPWFDLLRACRTEWLARLSRPSALWLRKRAYAAAAMFPAFGMAPLACKPSISVALNPSCLRTSSLCSPSSGARFAGHFGRRRAPEWGC